MCICAVFVFKAATIYCILCSPRQVSHFTAGALKPHFLLLFFFARTLPLHLAQLFTATVTIIVINIILFNNLICQIFPLCLEIFGAQLCPGAIVRGFQLFFG